MDALKALTQPTQVGGAPVLSLHQFLLDERERKKRGVRVDKSAFARAKADNDSAAVAADTATQRLHRLDELIAARDTENAKQRRKWFFPDDALLKRLEAEIATLTQGDIAAFKAECAELQERAREAQRNLTAKENIEERPVSDHADDVVNKPAKEEHGHEAELLTAILTRLGHPCSTHAVSAHPSFVRYTLRRLPDEKVEDGAPRLEALIPNVAMALQSSEVRMSAEADLLLIERPTPPGARPTLAALLASSSWRENPATVPVLLGVDERGQPQVADLAVLKHAVIVGPNAAAVAEVSCSFVASISHTLTPKALRVVVAAASEDDTHLIHGLPHALAPVATEEEMKSNSSLFAWDAKLNCFPRMEPLMMVESEVDAKLTPTLEWIAEEIRLRREAFTEAEVEGFDEFNTRGETDGGASGSPDGNLIFLNGTEYVTSHPEFRREKLPPKFCRLAVVLQDSPEVYLGFVHEDTLKDILTNGPRVGVHLILGLSEPKSDALSYVKQCGITQYLYLRNSSLHMDEQTRALFSNGEAMLSSQSGTRTRFQTPQVSALDLGLAAKRSDCDRSPKLNPESDTGRNAISPSTASGVRRDFVAAYGPQFKSGTFAHSLRQLWGDLVEIYPGQFKDVPFEAAIDGLIQQGNFLIVAEKGNVKVLSRTQKVTLEEKFAHEVERQFGLSGLRTVAYSKQFAGTGIPMSPNALFGTGD